MQTFTVTDAHDNIREAIARSGLNPSTDVLGEWLESVPEWQADAVSAWIATNSYSVDGDDLPVLSDFDEAYSGEWPCFRDYAEEYVMDTGMWQELPEWARPYFDVDKFARDLSFDHWAEDAPNGGVYVFRSI